MASSFRCLEFQLQRESLSSEEIQSVREHLDYQSDSLLSVRMTGKKPNFEVGSSSQLKLSLAKKTSPPGKTGPGALLCPGGPRRSSSTLNLRSR